MAAAHQVGPQAGVFARIGLAEDGDRRAFRRGRVRRTFRCGRVRHAFYCGRVRHAFYCGRVRPMARVEADPAVAAEPADAVQERSVAAAELDDGLPVKAVAIDQPLGE